MIMNEGRWPSRYAAGMDEHTPPGGASGYSGALDWAQARFSSIVARQHDCARRDVRPTDARGCSAELLLALSEQGEWERQQHASFGAGQPDVSHVGHRRPRLGGEPAEVLPYA